MNFITQTPKKIPKSEEIVENRTQKKLYSNLIFTEKEKETVPSFRDLVLPYTRHCPNQQNQEQHQTQTNPFRRNRHCCFFVFLSLLCMFVCVERKTQIQRKKRKAEIRRKKERRRRSERVRE